MQRPTKGRAIFYHRDSEGKSEFAPPQNVVWAQEVARKQGLLFSGTPRIIETMMSDGSHHVGDLFLDYGVSGNLLNRPGLDAMLETIGSDKSISHVIVKRRDRLARPDYPTEGLMLEFQIRMSGVTLVLEDAVLAPIQKGQQIDLGEILTAIVAYDQSGRFRVDLADKLIRAKIVLANLGVSIGGTPPYGFQRHLIDLTGKRKRILEKNEIVKQRGYQVAWLPTDAEKIRTVQRIFLLYETMSVVRIAQLLNDEKIPPPGLGYNNSRGYWHPSTIQNIVTNRIYIAVLQYGKRSEGDRLRFTPEGPRKLTHGDYDARGKLARVRNPIENVIAIKGNFKPVTDPTYFEKVQGIARKRAETQRAKKRHHGNNFNPLGCRIYDMACGWPLQRMNKPNSFSYRCAAYNQSNGKLCRHNTFDGMTASRYVLAMINQRILNPTRLSQIEKRIRELAADKKAPKANQGLRKKVMKEIHQNKIDLGLAKKNLALCKSAAQRQAVEEVFDELIQKQMRLEQEIQQIPEPCHASIDDEIDRALSVLLDLREKVHGPDQDIQSSTTDLFDGLNVQLYLSFKEVHQPRKMNKLSGGQLTTGAHDPVVLLYSGPTDKPYILTKIKEGNVSTLTAGESKAIVKRCQPTGLEGGSLGNPQCVTRRCT